MSMIARGFGNFCTVPGATPPAANQIWCSFGRGRGRCTTRWHVDRGLRSAGPDLPALGALSFRFHTFIWEFLEGWLLCRCPYARRKHHVQWLQNPVRRFDSGRTSFLATVLVVAETSIRKNTWLHHFGRFTLFWTSSWSRSGALGREASRAGAATQ